MVDNLQPAFLTGVTFPHLYFESTGHFLNSAIHTIIPLVQKNSRKSKALRDQLAGMDVVTITAGPGRMV